MRITIRSKNLKITPALQSHINSKISKVAERFLVGARRDAILDLEFSRATLHHRKGKVFHAEANLSIGKNLLRAEVVDEDMYVSVDLLSEEIKRELQKYSGKFQAIMKRGARVAKKELRLDPAARFWQGRRIREEGI